MALKKFFGIPTYRLVKGFWGGKHIADMTKSDISCSFVYFKKPFSSSNIQLLDLF